MEAIELRQTIARVKRAMPRNPDVMAICEYAEQQLSLSGQKKESK